MSATQDRRPRKSSPQNRTHWFMLPVAAAVSLAGFALLAPPHEMGVASASVRVHADGAVNETADGTAAASPGVNEGPAEPWPDNDNSATRY